MIEGFDGMPAHPHSVLTQTSPPHPIKAYIYLLEHRTNVRTANFARQVILHDLCFT
ncbi:hypothetical protein [Coxiella endosymbiont of Dermacentor marginatus]|uniref:hypothetical protein n=1 Tax=Coxiella endosymbiont of Dermacentor marginatus TaxID=1656159 RepID=UPI0022233078|nr:hypothetical protein [Coxiella endosymbiont of Dermacentor marginatus]